MRSRAVRLSDNLPGFCPVADAVEAMSAAGSEQRGAIFTKREVVDFILDLVGYTTAKPLHHMRLLEPSFGGGDFLIAAVERLLDSWSSSAAFERSFETLTNAVRAVEIHSTTFASTRAELSRLIADRGFSAAQVNELVDAWLIQDDFLLTSLEGSFDFVIGNPPYVRQELIADALMAEYRARFQTIYDRADIYIPFIERGLSLLRKGGQLGFICADRWMKNRYG